MLIGTASGNVYLYGSPGVECELKLADPPGLRIKFLQFAASAFKLLAIGAHASPIDQMSLFTQVSACR